MAKWADFGISHVHMNENETHIEKVRVYIHPDEKNGARKFFTVSRKFVVEQWDAKNTFVTIRKVHGQWVKGDDVHVWPVGKERFIKTDGNSIAADNLGNLPKF